MMIAWRRTIESEHWRVPEIIKASAKKNLRLTGYILNRWCHFQQRLYPCKDNPSSLANFALKTSAFDEVLISISGWN